MCKTVLDSLLHNSQIHLKLRTLFPHLERQNSTHSLIRSARNSWCKVFIDSLTWHQRWNKVCRCHIVHSIWRMRLYPHLRSHQKHQNDNEIALCEIITLLKKSIFTGLWVLIFAFFSRITLRLIIKVLLPTI